MICFYYGTDIEKARAKAHAIIKALHKKKPDAELFKLDSENFGEEKLIELSGGQGLFDSKFIVFCNQLGEDKERMEIVLKKIQELGASKNAFIFVEGKMDKATVEKIKKHAEKVECYGADTLRKKEAFNTFTLSDALGARDKKKLWVLYQEAVRNNVSSEEINGILFWHIKSMVLAREATSPEEADLNPFVYSKAKTSTKNFKEEELKKMSGRIVDLYHNARRGIHDFDGALERFILSI